MPNRPRITETDPPASFLSRLPPDRRNFLQEQIDPAQFAELERQRELAAAAAELRAQERAKHRPALEPVQRRVERRPPRTPEAPKAFYKVAAYSNAQNALALRRLRNRALVAKARIAMFSGGRDWTSAVANGVARTLIGLCMLADDRGVVRDVPMTLLLKLHRDKRTGKLRHPDTVGGGLHRPDGGLENGQAGYIRLLVEAGVLSAKQYRKRNPSQPDIAPSCNFYTLCEPEVPVSACETDEETERTLALLELAQIPHPTSGVHPRPPPHPPP